MAERLTAHQAADILGYHVNHVYYLLRTGRMEAEQFNRVWMIPRQEVDRIKALQGPGGRLPKAPKQDISTG
jgi:excisionase family DNA binding protein